MSDFLSALARQPVSRTPVWMMRQAGRYLPEYRAVREQAGDFMTVCRTPELACEVTLQPLRRFDLDAAIIFSDILVIPDAMGLGLYFVEGKGPKFKHKLDHAAAIRRLALPEIASLDYVMDAIKLVKQALAGRVPLIGFAGSPWTLATYMIEGQSSRTFARSKACLWNSPEDFDYLLSLLTEAVTQYLIAQVKAGVDVIMLFDSWGGALSTPDYLNYSLASMQQVLAGMKSALGEANVPSILFTKGGGQWLPAMAESGCAALGLDWTTDIAMARQQVGDQVALQGNLDPQLLLNASPKVVQAAVRNILHRYGDGPGHIFNLGHGILPGTPIENVDMLIATVHEEK